MTQDCPDCGTAMETESVSGTQCNALGAPVAVDVAWEQCPECGYVIDDLGNHIPPGDERQNA